MRRQTNDESDNEEERQAMKLREIEDQTDESEDDSYESKSACSDDDASIGGK